ncbi:MAG: ribose-phosphate diphosphokinase [Spirochaetes bacterium]|nr:ribose-phosphate diphosphokinase [Spirochaetota bacterium]
MNNFVICATRSMRKYAAAVTRSLTGFNGFAEFESAFDGVHLLTTERFADGEMEVVISSSIRGKVVFLFTSCARNECGVSVEEAKIELYNAVDALKRAQAEKIIIFEPFVSCSRSDRITRRSSVGIWVHMKILAGLGASHIVTYQLHSDKSKTILDPTICAIDDVPALNLLKQHLCDSYIKNIETLQEEVRNNWAFCSVDAGGEKITRDFANAFGAPLVVAHKQRDYSKPNSLESVNILSAEPLEGKSLWIVDDMIDTAGSVQILIRALSRLAPREINLVAVHALFSPPAQSRLSELLSEGLVKRIIVSDSVYIPASMSAEIPGIEIVSSTELSAKIIKMIVNKESLNKVLRQFNADIYLRSKAPL